MVNMIDKAIGSAGLWLLQNDAQKQRTDAAGMSTPEWMVQIGTEGQANASTIPAGDSGSDYTTYMELLKWEGRSNRDKRGLTGSHMLSSASLKNSPIEFQIPMGNYLPPLETMMYTAKNIDKITFVRLVSADGTQMVEGQKIEFSNCQFVYVEQSDDIIILVFHFTSRDNTVTSYDQLGAKIGDLVSSTVDFTTGVAKEGLGGA
jgi:hypothetical protein